MKRLLRILCALAVLITSSAFLLGISHAVRRLPVHKLSYSLAMVLFVLIGLLSLSGIYFILGLSKG